MYLMTECENCIKLQDQITEMRLKIERLVEGLDLHEIIWALKEL